MGRTARTYPPEVDVAIWAAKCEGVPTKEVLERLKRGELDGLDGPVSISDRTFYDHLARLRDKHGHEDDHGKIVRAGEEIEFADALLRRALTLNEAELSRLERAARSRGLKPAEAQTFQRLVRTLQDYKTREAARARQAGKAKGSNPSARASAGSSVNRSPDPVAQLKAAWEKGAGTEREDAGAREPVQSGPNGKGAQASTQREADGGGDARGDATQAGAEGEEGGGRAAQSDARTSRAQAWSAPGTGSGTDQGNITQA